MLKQRIVTALILLAGLVPAMLAPDTRVFAAVCVLFVAAGGWEWGRMNQSSHGASLGMAAFVALGCVVVMILNTVHSLLWFVWVVACGVWVLGGAWLLLAGVKAWPRVPQPLRLAIGVFALWVCWLAVVQARARGFNFLFSILALVWIADIFAYFTGKALGGKFFSQKLAPAISPGKTWEGAIGGLSGVLASAFVWRTMDQSGLVDSPSIYTLFYAHGWAFMALASLFLGSMSVVGDLVESLFKRSAGMKDSSGLLPGHGGVLDRIDAVLPVMPLAMLIASL